MHVKKTYVILALLVLVPTFIDLGVPIYNRDSPELLGMPFFYWFQTLWLFASAGFYIVFARIKGNQK